MRKRSYILVIGLVITSGCIETAYQPTYIISHIPDQGTVPTDPVEEPKESLR